ncbi:MAG: phosphate ABC transporter ATP-binding protein [Chloroflexi bacterium]|nr:phosphate ABC transporter ATP-binding protein [Chloroflexota bacterium]
MSKNGGGDTLNGGVAARSLLTGLRPIYEANSNATVKVSSRHLNFYYETQQALYDINLDIREKQVTALIGPSGSGKTTFLRTINRMNDVVPSARAEGSLTLDGQEVLGNNIDVVKLRLRVGMVFQRPNPFPKSIFENVAYALRVHKYPKGAIADRVEQSLREAALWEDVKDKLKKSAFALSGGQQQRLCIARAVALRPELLLMDEPAAALDPISTGKIEDLINELKKRYTIAIVTHNLQQAARVSEYCAFFLQGTIKEMGPTMQMFLTPGQRETEDFITGRFG